jgi:hypothetical protein
MESLNGFKTGAHYLNNLMIALSNEGCEGRAYAFLVVGYQDTHRSFCRTFHANG